VTYHKTKGWGVGSSATVLVEEALAHLVNFNPHWFDVIFVHGRDAFLFYRQILPASNN
jgi:hypothetical protein